MSHSSRPVIRSYAFAAVVALTCMVASACSSEPTVLEDGTAEMVLLLDSIAQNVNPRLNEYANRTRIEALERRPTPRQPEARMQLQGAIAQEMVNAGDTEEAIQILTSLKEQLDSVGGELRSSYMEKVIDLLALAWLRLGEQTNCVMNHTSASCLFPIRNEGVHTVTEASGKAIGYYEQTLREWRPDDMGARWLLNIAYMTLGRYPYDVPEKWLIPGLFEAEYDFPRFPDVAPRSGLADEMALSGGSITEDFNNDGLIDVVASSWGLSDQLHYYENNGDGTFTRKTEEAGLEGIVGGLNLVHADFDNNGLADIFVLRGAWLAEAGKHPNSLLRNNGDGTFSDVTESAGLLSYHPTQTAVWADFNNDGWLDLFIGNESTPWSRHPAELYISNQDGTFDDVAVAAGAAITERIKGVTAGDYNNDGYQDIYVSSLPGYNILLRNDGPNRRGVPQFTDVTERAGVGNPHLSFPTWFWDYNNDGWKDLFVAGYYATPADVANEYMGLPHDAELPRLYHNNGDGTFDDVTSEVELGRVMYAMGSNFGDLDNDGYSDFYVGTGDPDLRSLMPNRMFRNEGGVHFQEVTNPGGFGHLQKGHGVSFADIDNDGDQDIFAVIGGAMEGDVYMNALFHNPGSTNSWITLAFEGETSNKFGVGNRIRIETESEDGARAIHKTVGTGGSFGSSSLQQEIGLGKARRITRMEVFWPASGTTQVFEALEVNKRYLISERGGIEEVELHPFQF